MRSIQVGQFMSLYKLLADNYECYEKENSKPEEIVSEILKKSVKNNVCSPVINYDKREIFMFTSYFSKYERHDEVKVEIFNVTLFGFRIV